MKKLLTTTLLGLTALTTPIEAVAGTFNDHVRLAQAVTATGVAFRINPAECDAQPGVYGWYSPSKEELVVCQENKIKGSTKEVKWTAEDLDTLRHEAHHLVQDCVNGRGAGNFDGQLTPLVKSPIQLGKDVLGTDGIRQVAKTYADMGADEHTIILEIEAFSVARVNEPANQIAHVQRFCFD